MDRPSTAPRWKMQMRVFLRSDPRVPASRGWSKKSGGNPSASRANAPFLTKSRLSVLAMDAFECFISASEILGSPGSS